MHKQATRLVIMFLLCCGGTAINFERLGTKEGSGANEDKDRFSEINGGAATPQSAKNRHALHAGAGAGRIYYLHEKDLRDFTTWN